MKRLWFKSAVVSLLVGSVAQLAGFGDGCLNGAIQRILVSAAFD